MKSKINTMKVVNGLRILYTVLFVLSIVGTVLCLLCGVLFTAMDSLGVWEDPEIVSMIGDFSDLGIPLDFGALDLFMYGAAIAAIGTTVLHFFSKRFFKFVLEVDDIFDRTAIVKMQTLGILHLVIPFVCNFISGIFAGAFLAAGGLDVEISPSLEGPYFVLGLVYILLTFIFSYAADLKEENARLTARKNEAPVEPTADTDPTLAE